MSELKLSLPEIKELMDKLASAGLGGVTLREGDFELRIDAKQPVYSAVPCEAVPAAAVPAVPTAGPAAPAPVVPDGRIVKSPIVGTFYASASPDKPAYVQVGSRVKKGDVLFLIESMKLMNEIQSDYDGEVAEILVENAQGVEFGQPILVIK